MKTIKLNTLLLLISVTGLQTVGAQIPNPAIKPPDVSLSDILSNPSPEDYVPANEFLFKSSEVIEFGCVPNTECWWESISISFEGSGGMNFHQNEINRLENYARAVEANIQAYKNWISRQHTVIENEIERQLGESFSDYETAQDTYYKVKEQTLLQENISGYYSFIGDSPQSLKSKYSGKIAAKEQVRKEAVRKMKLVHFWKGLLESGRASYSKYGHLKYGDTPLNTLTNLSQLQAFVDTEETVFGDNEWRLETDKLIESKIFEIGNGVANREPAGYYNEIRGMHKDHYNRYDEFDQINLMQLYLTDPMELMEFHRTLSVYESEAVREHPWHAGRQFDWVSPVYFGASHVEDYAERNFGSLPYELRVFDPDYFLERTRSLGPGGIGRLTEEINNAKAAHINAAINALPLDAMFLETCFDNIGTDNRNFIAANANLQEAVATYFMDNDYSKVAVDCVHYLINQYRNNAPFAPDPKYYESFHGMTAIPCPYDIPKGSRLVCDARASYPIFQNELRKNLALEIRFTHESLLEGFRSFGDVLDALYANSTNFVHKGKVIRAFLKANSIAIPKGMSDETLGRYFNFEKNGYDAVMGVYFKPGIGELLWERGISLEQYLENLAYDEQIDVSGLTGKTKCIYEKLLTLSEGFRKAIQKFDGEFPVSHLKFEMEDLGNARGVTRAPDGAGNSPDYTITIVINNNSSMHGVEYRPNLMTAKTIAHEVLHAEMYRKLLSVLDNGGNLGGITRQDVINKVHDFPGIYDYFRRHKNWQHQQMATHYRESIADILQSFDNNLRARQFYMDITWEGLRYDESNGASSIYTWTNQSQEEKDRINSVISNYINNNSNENCR